MGPSKSGTGSPAASTNGLWLTPTSVFVTAYDVSIQSNRILELSKNPGAQPKIIGGLTGLSGLFIDGTTLYWAYRNTGGMWKCTLPACGTATFVSEANGPANP